MEEQDSILPPEGTTIFIRFNLCFSACGCPVASPPVLGLKGLAM